MPSHPPERTIIEAVNQTLDVVERADELGYSEVWLGEHLTVPWEPLPACDLLIAQAIPRTRQIDLCAGAYLLPFYNPGELACRIMQLDHMAQGRFKCAVATGFSPTDRQLGGVPDLETSRGMMEESLEIMTRIWTDHVGSEWTYAGKYWTITNPRARGTHGPHLKPFQSPYPNIALAGQTPRSSTITFAGSHGYLPISLIEKVDALAEHWDMYAEAAQANGHPVDRSDWRVVRQIFVADTDEEARMWMGQNAFVRHINKSLEGLRGTPAIKGMKHDPSVTDEEVTAKYLMEHWWYVGSVETVARRIADLHEAVGGFGTILGVKYDYADEGQRAAYFRSLELMAIEVIPAVTRMVERQEQPA